MCVNGRWIYNRYSGQKVFVRCGKCEACIQEDAMRRTNRIRMHQRNGWICLFVTLTYTNDFVPYVLRSDLGSEDFEINVYRNCSGRYVYSKKNGLRFKKDFGIDVIDRKFIDHTFRHEFANCKLKHLNGLSSDCIGVCYYPDLQDFFKRLRLNYEREYNKKLQIDYFAVSEFGGYSFRPHFHILLFIPASVEAQIRGAILKSWPYADSRRTAKFIEVAKNAASYVSSYVNSNVHISTCLSHAAFKQKHSQSKNLGVVMDILSLPAILEMVNRRDLHIYVEKKFDGTSRFTPLLVPKYVINRFFPKFKGMRWLAPVAFRSILVEPTNLWKFVGNYEEEIKIDIYGNRKITIPSRIDLPFNPHYDFGRSEIYSIVIRLLHAQLYFMSVTGLNAFDFAFYYEQVWNLYASSLIGDSLTSVERFEDFSEFYFNNADVQFNLVNAPTLSGLNLSSNPNNFHDLVVRSSNFARTYELKDKTKKVVNYSMEKLGYEV